MIKFEPLSFEQANPLITGLMSGQNIYKNSIQNKYLPLSTQAEAASKLAYARLMGPQFLAKLMGNPSLLANIDESQKNPLLQQLVSAGTGQGTGNGYLNNSNGISEAFSNSEQTTPNQTSRNTSSNNGFFGGLADSISKFFNNGNPAENNQPNRNVQQQVSNNMAGQEQNVPMQPPKTFAENEAEYASTVEQGKTTGKGIGESITNMGDQYEAGLRLNDKLKGFTKIFNDPEFKKMRSEVPLFQDKQLSVLSTFGTPYQQELIGGFRNTADEVIKDTLNSFQGTKLRGEIEISKNMKIKDSDTFNVAIGKLKSAMLYKDLNMKRIEIASELMDKKHISKVKAFEIADKQLNTNAVMDNIQKQLDYPVQIISNKTGKVETVPVSEARKRGAKNV